MRVCTHIHRHTYNIYTQAHAHIGTQPHMHTHTLSDRHIHKHMDGASESETQATSEDGIVLDHYQWWLRN